MKGIVFNILEELVTRDHGADTWDTLLDAAKVDGSYTSLGNYPDAELFAIVGAASKALNVPANDLIRWFGREAIAVFVRVYPQLFAPHKETRPFLLTLNEVIHPEVRKLYPGASVPEFDYTPMPGGGLMLGYRSPKKLCALGEGLIQGTAAHYRQAITLAQPRCMLKGDDHCEIVCTFGKTA